MIMRGHAYSLVVLSPAISFTNGSGHALLHVSRTRQIDSVRVGRVPIISRKPSKSFDPVRARRPCLSYVGSRYPSALNVAHGIPSWLPLGWRIPRRSPRQDTHEGLEIEPDGMRQR